MPNSDKSNKIRQIIQQREPLVTQIEQVTSHLITLYNNIDSLNRLRERIINEITETAIKEHLTTLRLEDISLNIFNQIHRLNQLITRYKRGTINIGVVGLMGQGKSQFLQSISRLGDEVIPAKSGQACTACKSSIEYQEGETKADVTFHTIESFLNNIIAPYYDALKLTPPRTLEDFEKPLPVPNFSESGDATLKTIYEHLKNDYHENLQHYKHHLQRGIPKILSGVNQNEIYKYVSQPRDEQGNLRSFDHLAVNSVKIACHFPNQEVQQIALVDVPGLGDTRLGDEQLMLETLGQEVDLVLFIRRPDADNKRYGWEPRDTDLYKTAYQSLDSFDRRSFMVLNYDGNNGEACQHHKDNIKARHINVVACEIANCSDPNEANRVLDLVLDYMLDNITYLDEKYVRTYQEEVNKLQQRVTQELEKARQEWTTSSFNNDINELGKFLRLFKSTLSDLKGKLEALLDNLDQDRHLNEEDENDFKQEVISVIEHCKQDTGIPEIEQIIKRKIDENDWPSTYARYLHDVRTRLTRNFASMENGMSRKVEEAKVKVTEILRDSIHLGNIPQLVNCQGNDFLKKFLEIIPDELNNLKQPIETLANFEMNYRNHIRYLVRPYLDNLNPDKTNMQLTPIKESGIETAEIKSKKAEEIQNYLEILHGEAIYNCEVHLPLIYSKPSEEIFMEIEEFVDQILRSETVEEQWQILLFSLKSSLWPEEFGGNTQGNYRQQWLNLVEQVNQANQFNQLQFIN